MKNTGYTVPLVLGSKFFAATGFLVLPFAAAPEARGHDSLYHYVELRLPRVAGPEADGRGEGPTEVAELSFSIHAAELKGAEAAGAEPDSTDLAWLVDMEEQDYERLIEEALGFIARSYRLFLAGAEGKEAEPIPVEGRLAFPGLEALRADPTGAEGARPGFLLGTLALERSATEGLRIDYSPEAEKRLLFVLNRPGDFPKVRDLAPGDSASVAGGTIAPARAQSPREGSISGGWSPALRPDPRLSP